MFKNVAAQKIELFAFDITTGAPKTGDAANITAYLMKDHGAVTVLGDVTATEMDATNAKGVYQFDLTQAETNADEQVFTAKSTTANVSIVPRFVSTLPVRFTTLVIDAAGLVDANAVKIGPTGAGTAQTARDVGASVLLSAGTGTGQLDFTSGVVKSNITQWLGTAVSTPTVAGVPNVNVRTWNDLTTVALPLVPTVAGRTLGVAAGGQAGVDWANVGSPTTVLGLTNTTIGTVTTYTGNTPQTGDSFARLGAPAGASVSADVAAIKAVLPVALVAGRIDASVGAMATGVITATTFAAGAIDAAAIATDAITSAELASSATAEIAAAVRTELTTELGRIDVASSTLATAANLALVPTAVQNADALLNRDMSTGTDSGSPTVRTVRQALRFLRNKFVVSGAALTVYKEDDATASWTSALTTTAGADPVTGSDPA